MSGARFRFWVTDASSLQSCTLNSLTQSAIDDLDHSSASWCCRYQFADRQQRRIDHVNNVPCPTARQILTQSPSIGNANNWLPWQLPVVATAPAVCKRKIGEILKSHMDYTENTPPQFRHTKLPEAVSTPGLHFPTGLLCWPRSNLINQVQNCDGSRR